MVTVAGIPGKACDEYGLDNHCATPPHESHSGSSSSSCTRVPPSTDGHCDATAPIVPNPGASKLLESSLSRTTMAWPNPQAPAIVSGADPVYYKAASLLNGEDKSYENNDLIASGKSTTHMRDRSNSHYQQRGFQLWKCLEMACECVRLLKKMLLLVLIVGAQKVDLSDACFFDDECVDSGGSSSSSSSSTNQGSGGGSSSSGGSGSGKKQQNTNSTRSGSSSSSSQRSGSGSSQRGGGGGGTGMGGGGGRRLSSSDSSDDGDDDDHNKRPRQQLNKEPKPKPDFDDEEDDEETDSADEGGDDHSPSAGMTLELNSPTSAVGQNDSAGGGSMSSHVGGLGVGEGGGGGGGEGKGQEAGRRGRHNIGSLPLIGGSGGGVSGTTSSTGRFSMTNMSGGATVESITLKEGIAGGGGVGSRIATTTLISSSQINSPVNMAVGYGVPVLAATDGDGLINTTAAVVGAGGVGVASSSSVPNSELGTPTQDSPSPPSPNHHLGRGRDTPGTPQAMSPEIAPNPQVKYTYMYIQLLCIE